MRREKVRYLCQLPRERWIVLCGRYIQVPYGGECYAEWLGSFTHTHTHTHIHTHTLSLSLSLWQPNLLLTIFRRAMVFESTFRPKKKLTPLLPKPQEHSTTPSWSNPTATSISPAAQDTPPTATSYTGSTYVFVSFPFPKINTKNPVAPRPRHRALPRMRRRLQHGIRRPARRPTRPRPRG